MKLSKVQQEVIDLMKDGWELGTSTGFFIHTCLQKGGQGKGGDTKDISIATVNALKNKGLIEHSLFKYPIRHWKLTLTKKALN
jgi:hypothetical protein